MLMNIEDLDMTTIELLFYINTNREANRAITEKTVIP